MIDCMLCSSLAIEANQPLLAFASHFDLDGPALLAQDRAPKLQYQQQWLHFRQPGH
ncbi:hypothetical protein [Shewanella sp. YLB-07]|uniref:hypothetical protein n=1 Tax=Shewanella sp. YLB-07 TaxID=2601268 RepID=UPI001883F96B|nr:hypothetical protein [Shewanella sp. YLB-07]